MRDILTVIAGVLVFLLVTALIAPPFVDWDARRGLIERAITRATGVPVKTEGRIEVRLLPSPRLRLASLRVVPGGVGAPALEATHVKAEMALTPLLRGEVRFTETRVGRAEIRVPTAIGSGEWRLSPDLLAGFGRRIWAVDDLRIAQFLLTLTAPATGRTDQFYGEGIRIEGQSTGGPWRAEGTVAGIPFRLATGGAQADGTATPFKLNGGGDLQPRFEIDGRMALDAAPEDLASGSALTLSGSAKVSLGPPAQVASAGMPVPVSIQTTFKTSGRVVELQRLVLDAGDAAGALQLAGTGFVDLNEPRLTLTLDARRFDADAFLGSAMGESLLSGRQALRWPELGMPTDVEIKLDSVGLAAGGDWTNLAVEASINGGTAILRRSEITGPGQTRLSAEGRLGLKGEGFTGRVGFASSAPDRLVRVLGQTGFADPLVGLAVDGPIEVTADVAIGAPLASFRDARIKIGSATLTGAGRYTAPEDGGRGRFDAQIAAQGIDLARMPSLSSTLGAMRDIDIGLVLEARDVRYGRAPDAGRIAARVRSNGRALEVDTLEITNLAGANATVAGRFAPDGSGRIEGDVRAERAAPLLDLLGTVWAGQVIKGMPALVRDSGVELHLLAERDSPETNGSGPALKASARGRLAGGDFTADLVMRNGRAERISTRLATRDAGSWIDRPRSAALNRPATLSLDGGRDGNGRFTTSVTGDIAGVALTTRRPFTLNPGDDLVESGEADLVTADLTPFLSLLGAGASVPGLVPAQLKVAFARDDKGPSLEIGGRIAGSGLEAKLSVSSGAPLSGSLKLDRLSLPWLTGSLALDTPRSAESIASWPATRFGTSQRLLRQGQARFAVKSVDLGRGFVGEDASFTLEISPNGMSLRDMRAGFAGGRLEGTLAITRQGSQASFAGEGSIADVALSGVTGPGSPFEGRLSASLRFGASGETIAGAVENLSGSGDIQVSDVRVERADPGAIDRALARDLADSDPLGPGRLDRLVVEELGRGTLAASGLAGPATLIGGSLRVGPFHAEGGPATWDGAGSINLKTLTMDLRGTLKSKAPPIGWTGSAPAILLGWKGPIARPGPEVDVAPLVTGVAAIVLQRELDRIEDFEADANERARHAHRLEMDRARKAAEEAARQAKLREERAEEAARQARLREEAVQLERARAAQERAVPPAARPQGLPELPPVLEVRPGLQARPGG